MKRSPFFLLFVLAGLTACMMALPLHGQNQGDSLIAFVGKKIYVRDITPPDRITETKKVAYQQGADTFYTLQKTLTLDGIYEARYEVILLLNGNYTRDTIDFTAADHYGTPGFAEYEHVLLFVYPSKSGFYHVKYAYTDVYQTTDGRWAGAYQRHEYEKIAFTDTDLKPEKIPFRRKVSYLIDSPVSEENVSYYFPSPYFKIRGKRAFAVYGNYVEELLELKKQGTLKSRWRE